MHLEQKAAKVAKEMQKDSTEANEGNEEIRGRSRLLLEGRCLMIASEIISELSGSVGDPQ